MQTAFKEWAVVVEALGQGEQIILLRKGGVQEVAGEFEIEHSRFFLFPTMFHQQRESVIPSAGARFDQLPPLREGDDFVPLEFFAEVVFAQKVLSSANAGRMRGQHIWRDEVIAKRFDWGKETGIHALALRVHRLPAPLELPMLPAYRGCKSWVKLEHDIRTDGAKVVLSDEEFTRKLDEFRSALEPAPATP